MISTPAEKRRIDAEALQERLATSNPPRLLDVRAPAEFEAMHIPGSHNVPLATLREHREELRHHLDTNVVLVCLSGGRAQQAEKALTEVGLPGLWVLEGGMRGWQDAGGAITRGRQIWDLERQVRFVAASGAYRSLSSTKLISMEEAWRPSGRLPEWSTDLPGHRQVHPPYPHFGGNPHPVGPRGIR